MQLTIDIEILQTFRMIKHLANISKTTRRSGQEVPSRITLNTN